MRSDDIAAKIIRIDWDRVSVKGGDGPASDEFYGRVMIGDTEFKRFKISKNDYTSDQCAPCASTAKKLRQAIASAIREEYGSDE